MKQSLTTNGTNTSVKVYAIISNGIMIEAFGNDYFLSYNSNPWFENAKINDVFNVEPVGTSDFYGNFVSSHCIYLVYKHLGVVK